MSPTFSRDLLCIISDLPTPSLIPATLESQYYLHFPDEDSEAQRGEGLAQGTIRTAG